MVYKMVEPSWLPLIYTELKQATLVFGSFPTQTHRLISNNNYNSYCRQSLFPCKGLF